jgi:hypothetical protein
MEHRSDTGIQVDPVALQEMIHVCKAASGGVFQILHALKLNGQTSQEWAGDAVSHDVASHYTLQLWSGAHCTYSALNNYYNELRSTIEALGQTLAGYNNSDGTTAETMEQL